MNKIHIYTTPELFPNFCYLGSSVKYNRSFDYAEKHYFDTHSAMLRRAEILNNQLKGQKPDPVLLDAQNSFRQTILNKLSKLKLSI
jgi:hypothetical protein